MYVKLCPIITGTDLNTPVRDIWMIPSVRESWTRVTVANGGYYTGGFEISGIAENDIKDFFNRYLGFEVQERTLNQMTWNGFIYRMTLEINGVQYVRTLEPDWFHNWVMVYYSNLEVEDTNQGAMNYRTVPLRFSDDGQDFSAYETLAGDAIYRIQVANTNGTTSWAYMGASSSVTNPNDTIAVYSDLGLTVPGWNDEDPIGPPALTPASYQVFEIALEGLRYTTGWAADTDSADVFGRVDYVISIGGAEAAAASTLRDRHLEEFGYPRTRMTGGVEIVMGQRRDEKPVLTVDVAGFVSTLFWLYRFDSHTDTISNLIQRYVACSEFIDSSDDTVTTNTLQTTADCYPMPQRIGDILQMLVDQGDAAGNAYQWGVYDRTLYYEPRPTTPNYILANGQLYDLAGTQVIPQLLRPGFLLQTRDAPAGLLPYGGATIDNTNVAYVEEIEFSAPNKLRLTLSDPNLAGTIAEQIQSGSYTNSLTMTANVGAYSDVTGWTYGRA